MKDSASSSFLAGIVVGGLVGAAVGLLLAPESGEEMREHVGGLIDEKRAQFDEAVSEGRAAAEQARAEMAAGDEGGPQPEGATS